MIQLNKLFLILLLIPMLSIAQSDIMSFNNSVKFARYLSTTRQYDFAIEEYERLVFNQPNDTLVSFELAKTYRLGKKCNKFGRVEILFAKNNALFSSSIFTRELVNFCLTCNNFDNYDGYINYLSNDQKKFYKLSKLWIQGDYKSIRSFDFGTPLNLDKKQQRLYGLSTNFKLVKYKKPGLALAMSAIIPGSGKLYAKRPGDALMSFIFVMSNVIVSYRAFSKKGIHSANGWVFGGLALSFYAGNLWGSYKAAKDYNNHINHTYQNNAQNIIYSTF